MKTKMKGGGAVSFNMTPMIDIVFNLIIFFMLVSQFYQMKVEPVTLPPAAKADPKREELQKFTQIVINVVPPDTQKNPDDRTTLVKVDGKVYMTSVYGGGIPDPDPLIQFLKERKAAAEEKKLKPVNVILRAGENVHYETIGRVMLCASYAGIPYWWVQARRPVKGDDETRRFLGVPVRTSD